MTSTQILHMSHEQLYETDFVEWIDQAAELLRQGRFDQLDIENLIEEVETLGRSEKRALESNLRVLLMHLLKWQYQPSRQSNSWRGTIREHRLRIEEIFEDSPSLKGLYTQVFAKTYQKARKKAADETGLLLTTFPMECPYTTEQVLDEDFLPRETTTP